MSFIYTSELTCISATLLHSSSKTSWFLFQLTDRKRIRNQKWLDSWLVTKMPRFKLFSALLLFIGWGVFYVWNLEINIQALFFTFHFWFWNRSFTQNTQGPVTEKLSELSAVALMAFTPVTLRSCDNTWTLHESTWQLSKLPLLVKATTCSWNTSLNFIFIYTVYTQCKIKLVTTVTCDRHLSFVIFHRLNYFKFIIKLIDTINFRLINSKYW